MQQKVLSILWGCLASGILVVARKLVRGNENQMLIKSGHGAECNAAGGILMENQGFLVRLDKQPICILLFLANIPKNADKKDQNLPEAQGQISMPEGSDILHFVTMHLRCYRSLSRCIQQMHGVCSDNLPNQKELE